MRPASLRDPSLLLFFPHLLLRLRDHLLRDDGGDLLVVRHLHCKLSAAGGDRTKVGRIAEDLRQRHLAPDDLALPEGVDAKNRPRRWLRSPMMSPTFSSG